jgi:hypothetical protein
VATTALFAAVAIWTSMHHEPWRDEVVPLSIARRAGSLAELAEPLKFEGHPILWYLLLWCAYHLVGQAWVLKAASVGTAIGAIFLLNRSPLPWWLRGVFTFSFFPLYQYGVVSRGYSLEMLLLFVFCAVYPHRREHPLILACVLAALANTEAFGLIMAGAAVAMLLVEGVMAGRGAWRGIASDRRLSRRLLGAASIVGGGVALSAAVAFPDTSHPLTGFQRLDLAAIAVGVGGAVVYPVAHATQFTVVPYADAWVWAYFAYLARRPAVLTFCALSLVGMEVLFNLVYGPGAPWHVGNVFLVLVASAWLDAAASTSSVAIPAPLERGRRWLGRALAVAIVFVFANHAWLAAQYVTTDVANDYSANRRLAELMRDDPSLATAIVMGEPDTPLWSVPYYLDNRIFLPREGVFRDWGMFSSSRPAEWDLDALLRTARSTRDACACPVVITMGYDVGRPGAYTNFPGTRFEERFRITPEARDAFLAATQPLARLGPTLTDENYDVFVLR